MSSLRILLALFLMVALLNSCGARDHEKTTASRSPGQSCLVAGTTLDSTFAVMQARRALSQSGLPLDVQSFQGFREQGIELGLLISMVTGSRTPVLGGG